MITKEQGHWCVVPQSVTLDVLLGKELVEQGPLQFNGLLGTGAMGQAGHHYG
ncbi:MAG: hypothetical protein JWP57_3468 [Spirosoma sp.]|nr:hypothetical protein [Spirosoma sp.]